MSRETFLPPLSRGGLSAFVGAAVWLALGAVFSHAADADAVRAQLLAGKYADAADVAGAAEKTQPEVEDWPLLRAEALMAAGKYPAARDEISAALERFPYSMRLRLAGYDVFRANGDTERAKTMKEEMDRFGGQREWAYREPADRVALGKAAILLGADPKRVMGLFFDPVRKTNPEFPDAYLAGGELALAKSDFALAAKSFAAAMKKFPENPEAHFGLARAFAPGNSEAAQEQLEKTLELNPNHVGARLLLADEAIDAEKYPEADRLLAEALAINPHDAEAHSLRAVLAHLRSDAKAEADARAAALKLWPANPAVPNLIGRKLSQHYRFAEGAALQREALKFDGAFIPAKIQLAQDLLRLGRDEEGWQLAEEVQKADPYDVVAFNLTELRDTIAHFRLLKSVHFDVRMDPHEADLYGADVLVLLERAYATLTKKYGIPLRERTVVEIFPDQKDFAIRTFGLPGGAGYLGVCFGRVITANSPASRPGSPSNWQAVLWHEFTHVITLTLTKNKMPRWLSEGISVFEERQQRASWGEHMTPRYRAMILGDDLAPVSQLSASFMRPKTPAHLQFAYYESSLVVEWLIKCFGMEKMRAVLADLARGVAINEALAAHFAPIEKLDTEFAAHARDLANGTGPKLDWTKPAPAALASEPKLRDWIAQNPDNFTALVEQARQLITEKSWEAAKVPLKKLIALYPEQHDAESAYALLAHVHRELGEFAGEEAMLNKVAVLCSDAPDVYARLMEIAAARADWRTVLANAERFTAVNPLAPAPYRFIAEAREATGDKAGAIAAYRTLLAFNPPDRPEIHFRLARILHSTGDAGAKREALLALEETPRFREAHRLLLEIEEQPAKTRPAAIPGPRKKP
ncbi:MAG: tetratricopeptide repeat protein [Chthoniobacteraceae bacterium]